MSDNSSINHNSKSYNDMNNDDSDDYDRSIATTSNYYGYGKSKRRRCNFLSYDEKNAYNNSHHDKDDGYAANNASKPTASTIRDDYADCGQCGNDCLFDETQSCSCCEAIRCRDCDLFECNLCKTREEQGEYLILGPNVCLNCVADGCSECPDLTICKNCISDHVQECSHKTRTLRAVSEASMEMAVCQEAIDAAKQQVASAQMLVLRLQQILQSHQKRKWKADRILEKAVKNHQSKGGY